MISNTNKTSDRKNKILFINAVKEVKQDTSIAFLDEDHIQRIFSAYVNYKDDDGFCKVVTKEEILKKGSSLNLPIYVSNVRTADEILFKDAFKDWETSSEKLNNFMSELFGVLD